MKTVLVILLVCILQTSVAQDNQLLFHYSRHKQRIYKIDDVIAFRIKGSDEKHTWQITDLTDSTIVSGERSIKPHQVSHIYVDKEILRFSPLRYNWAPKFIIAGIAYAALDLVNRREFDTSTAIVSGSLVGAGLVGMLVIKKHIKLKRGRKLVILR